MTTSSAMLNLHIKKYNQCKICDIGKRCTTRVYYRGILPCDILIVGEAPDDIEWVIGDPFVGPAGSLLDKLIEDVFGSSNLQQVAKEGTRIAMTNAITCIPQDKNATKLRTPTNDEITNCSYRLSEFIDQIAKPKCIVAAGAVAQKSLKRKIQSYTDFPLIDMIHPSAILRQEERGELDYKRAIDSLQKAKEAITDV